MKSTAQRKLLKCAATKGATVLPRNEESATGTGQSPCVATKDAPMLQKREGIAEGIIRSAASWQGKPRRKKLSASVPPKGVII